jgi:hypothetical protein
MDFREKKHPIQKEPNWQAHTMGKNSWQAWNTGNRAIVVPFD